MKLIKVLLACMFTFTAIIRSTDVGTCGSRRHRYQGILAHYDVRNAAGRIVDTDVTACGANWPEIKQSIKDDLQRRQMIVEEMAKANREERRLKEEAKDLVGAEVTGN